MTIVLVSEYTRRIAHELDDKHRDWIITRQRDDLAESLEPNTQLSDILQPNHLAMLTDYGNIENNYRQICEHRRRVENRMAWIRRDKANLLRRYSADSVAIHMQAMHNELVYIERVQMRLKQVRRWIRAAAAKDNPLDDVMGLVYKALDAGDIEILRNGLDENGGELRNRITDTIVAEASKFLQKENSYLIVSSFIAQQWEIEQ